MKFLITGGAGFLGSAICKQLVKMKAEVLVFDSPRKGCFIHRFIKIDFTIRKQQ